MNFFISPNKRKRQHPISIIVIHYTEIDWLQTKNCFLDPKKEVSSHLVIDIDGTVNRFVDDDEVAYHAGKSYWRGITGVNDYSIGIELVHPGFTNAGGIRVDGNPLSWVPYAQAQINTLIEVCKNYIEKYKIMPYNIVGHSDIAPGRKQDPGPLFPWHMLSKKGIGMKLPTSHHPTNKTIDSTYGKKLLQQIGYFVDDEPSSEFFALQAFQMHFRQKNISGKWDPETIMLLKALAVEIGV